MKNENKRTAKRKTARISVEEPIAPFQQVKAFELALLAVLLSKGRNPGGSLRKAASLWAEALAYRDRLWHLYVGKEFVENMGDSIKDTVIVSTGSREKYLSVDQACAKYACGQKHLRDLIKEVLKPHLFQIIWHLPVKDIRLPLTLLEWIEHLRAERRSARSKKGKQGAHDAPQYSYPYHGEET